MVEQQIRIPINRAQGAVLTSVGMRDEFIKDHYEYIGVEIKPEERVKILNELEEKGYLRDNNGVLELTEEGTHLQRMVDIAFLKED